MEDAELRKTFEQLLALPAENEWLEFREAKTSINFEEMGQYFSALSNEANLKSRPCGWLILGVRDKDRQIIGTRYRTARSELDKLKHEIANHTIDRITFVEIHELYVTGRRAIMFQIPPAPKGVPTTWKGHFYGREGESIGPLTLQEIDQIRNQGKTPDWSAQGCPEATIDDLEPKAISKAKQEYKQKNPQQAREVDEWEDLAFLNKAKVTKQGQITRAAIILLGREESEHFISPSVAQITWVLKDADNVEKDYEHFGPPFMLNAERVFTKIRNLKYRYLPDESLFPIEINQYDAWVIREALHNCIAHQDYELRGRISIVETLDELIFTNVGSFIPGDVETVIVQDSPPEIYRNQFLATAMVNLNMIETIGGGIKKMFRTQRERLFPLPDYDLSQANKVIVKIQGRVLNENYSRLLIKNRDIDLSTVMLLDKVQKNIKLSKGEYKVLKARGLVEGRYPNVFLSSGIAAATRERAKYIRDKGFADQYYKDMITKFIGKFESAGRGDINELLMDKLSDALDERQKRNKISNLLYAMSKKDKTIMNKGSKRKPQWMLRDIGTF